MHLDVVGLEAALVALARIARHVGEAGNLALQGDLAFRHTELERDAPHRLQPLTAVADRIAEAGHPHPVLHQAFEVNVRR